ncbi:hypothetical protein F2Q70_00008688 [Brassica cretica]|uniref:Uncharacterized protein n=1 Tax=Brassica cretica TaxID=69181 RepID=A0A8S9M912_BRACR|nr:hypothetical protein F2Q70_00008688 [Brassica cretica]
MMHIYASCDVWELGTATRWRFSVDEGKKGKLQDGDSPWMKGKGNVYSLGIEIYFRRVIENGFRGFWFRRN